MGNVLPKFYDASWEVMMDFEPSRAFAICSYLFFFGFLLAMAALINRYMLKRRLKKNEEMNSLFSRSGQGSTRAILWTIGFAFFLRSCWCLMKAFPYEPLACPYNASQPGLPPHNATQFGSWQYNIRETMNRSGTMLYFTSYSIIAFFFARCCADAVSLDNKGGAAPPDPEPRNNEEDMFDMAQSPSSSGEFVAERIQRQKTRSERTLNSIALPKPKKTVSPFTCAQGLFVTLNLWLYIAFLVFMLTAWFDPSLDDPCDPVYPSDENECAGKCKPDWFPLPYEKIQCKPPWYFIHETEIIMSNALFGILMIGVVYYGIKLFSIILKRRAVNKSLRVMSYKILAIVIVCLVGFSTRIILGLWTVVGLPHWSDFWCEILRPYGQYLVSELIPGIVLIVCMIPDCRTTTPKERRSSLELQASSASGLLSSESMGSYYDSTRSIIPREFKGEDDEEHLAGVGV